MQQSHELRVSARARFGPPSASLRAAGCIAILIAGVTAAASRTPPADAAQLRAGERIYRQGILPSGEPLQASREGAEPMLGKAAACANCHGRSGLGTLEGRIFIPPITPKYLFRSVSADAAELTQTSNEMSGASRSRYTEATLARALREGVDPDGRTFDYLMPRFTLDDGSMHSLISYLGRLSRGPVRGVSDETIDFATIVASDADADERRGMLDVLDHCFGAKGASNQGEASVQSARELQSRGARAWRLHVWELTGQPEEWGQQLRQHLSAQPVFAVVSGLGRKNWAPVHQFCEAESLPCLLPNVDLPVVEEGDFYPVYFSQGVLLEAKIIATRLQTQPTAAAPRRVVQIFRSDDIGAAAAAALQHAAGGDVLKWRQHVLRPGAGALALALNEVRPEDALVLWLRPKDLEALPGRPPAAAAIFASGLMGGLEQAPLPGGWRPVVRMSYPFELPTRRGINMDYARGWFAFHHIPMVAERVQTDTYLACGILTEAVGHMLNNLTPDYLVELIETQLSHRLVNGYYPRLGLAPGQRFASKGGYLVRFEDSADASLVPDGDWIVP
ncbi:MAG: c-type cytochrome [Casimicrobiaceae bacterium]